MKNEIQIKLLLWAVGSLLAILSVVAMKAADSFLEMNRAINRIEVKMAAQSVLNEQKTASLQYRVETLERRK